MDNDQKTTIAGGAVSLGVLSSVDVTKLFQGDHAEIGKLVVGVTTMAWAWFTNKH